MITVKENKLLSKKQLSGKWRGSISVLLAQAGINLVCFVCLFVPYFFATGVLGMGVNQFFLEISKGKNPDVPYMLIGFTNYLKNLGLSLLKFLFLLIWYCLLIVPGIIVSLELSLTTYLIRDNPNKKVMDIINESRTLMKGHRKELFKLKLSFLGWFLLSILTAGILLFYVLPYYKTTKANFYNNIIKKGD